MLEVEPVSHSLSPVRPPIPGTGTADRPARLHKRTQRYESDSGILQQSPQLAAANSC